MSADGKCQHGVDRERASCAPCEELDRRARRHRAAWKPVHARPLSTDQAPSLATPGDRVAFSEDQAGMTLLEHYAGLAMAASDPATWKDKHALARHARECAEALISELYP